MRVSRKCGTGLIGLGFRALKGGGVVVGVVVEEGDPRVVLSTYLPTAADGNRFALEPYRVALQLACSQCGLEVAEIDEKSLPGIASEQLRLSSQDMDGRLKSLGATVGRPWRREQKLACLSAWVTVAALQAR